MSIRQLRKEPDLPCVRLFLEDIEDLAGVLSNAAKPDSLGQKESVVFDVGQRQCDDLEDLRTLGGSTYDFRISVGNMSTLRLSRYGWSLLTRDEATNAAVRRILASRIQTHRNLFRLLPGWFDNLLVTIAAMSELPLAVMVFNSGFGAPLRVAAAILFCLLPVFLYRMVFIHSVIEFRYSHDKSDFHRLFKEYGLPIVTAIIGAAVGALVTYFLKH